MTCVLGYVAADGSVVIAADSMTSTSQGDKHLKKSPKIRRVGELLVGADGDVALCDLMWRDDWPQPNTCRERLAGTGAVDGWIRTHLVPWVRAEAKEAGLVSVRDGSEAVNGDFLIGVRGRLVKIDCAFGTRESADLFDGIGMGWLPARGALKVLGSEHGRCADVGEAHGRLMQALHVAAECNTWVAPPFDHIFLDPFKEAP